MRNWADGSAVVSGPLVAVSRYWPGALIRSARNWARPAVAISDPPLTVPSAEPSAGVRTTGLPQPLIRAPAPSTTSTATGGPDSLNGVPVITWSTSAAVGWVTNRSAQLPLTGVASELPGATA